MRATFTDEQEALAQAARDLAKNGREAARSTLEGGANPAEPSATLFAGYSGLAVPEADSGDGGGLGIPDGIGLPDILFEHPHTESVIGIGFRSVAQLVSADRVGRGTLNAEISGDQKLPGFTLHFSEPPARSIYQAPVILPYDINGGPFWICPNRKTFAGHGFEPV
jgi:hypothetical protein